jgi:hypothetical protein
VEVPTRLPLTRRDWPQALHELARQLDDGRIYDRDLSGLSVALDAVLEAYNRRPYVRLRTSAARSGVPDAHLVDECARDYWRTGGPQEAPARRTASDASRATFSPAILQ